MKKMLYFMNVDWNWIKQRPHFLAECLQKYYELLIVNQYRYSKKSYQNRQYDKNIYLMKVIPRIDRYRGLLFINSFLKKKLIKRKIKKFQPEYLYLTYPEHYNWIPDNYKGIIIYDCMDDHCGLSRNKRQKKEIVKIETKLCERADFLFVTSQYLKDVMCKRYGGKLIQRAKVVRNAFGGEINKKTDFKKVCESKFVICYFGTISDWFDFELVSQSLVDFDNIEYLIMGPLYRNVKILQNTRIRYLGTVEYEMLQELTAEADCFIMPFILDESIKAVDPVKIYEYINFNKNIISIRYKEVERFSDFAFFYDDYNEFKQIISNLLNNNEIKYSPDMRLHFLKDNCWECRANEIHSIIKQNTLE